MNPQSWTLKLPNGGQVTGLASFPTSPETTRPRFTPLVVAIHGGTYSAQYFFPDAKHSVLPISQALQIPFLAINRPGYKDSTPFPAPIPKGSSYLREEGKYIHEHILPTIWNTYATSLGVNSIVIMSHSLGASAATVTSGLHAASKEKLYPLAGLVIGGIGTEIAGRTGTEEALATKPPMIHFPVAVKDIIMLGSAEQAMTDPDMYAIHPAMDTGFSYDECVDCNHLWITYWTEYARQVNVPVMYGLASADALWTVSEQHVQDFARAFSNSPRVERGLVHGAPHCMELSYVSRGWYARALGFALECSVGKALERS